jgi:hypothetical protein
LSTLFVRQGFTPLFDVPIKIENPDEPLGTHVFTLLELQSEGTSFRWNVVSLPEKFSSASANLNKKPKAPVQASGGTVRPDLLPDDYRRPGPYRNTAGRGGADLSITDAGLFTHRI